MDPKIPELYSLFNTQLCRSHFLSTKSHRFIDFFCQLTTNFPLSFQIIIQIKLLRLLTYMNQSESLSLSTSDVVLYACCLQWFIIVLRCLTNDNFNNSKLFQNLELQFIYRNTMQLPTHLRKTYLLPILPIPTPSNIRYYLHQNTIS